MFSNVRSTAHPRRFLVCRFSLQLSAIPYKFSYVPDAETPRNKGAGSGMLIATYMGMRTTPKSLFALAAVAAFAIAHPASANLITNGGFETGNFTDWITPGTGAPVNTADGIAPHSGSWQALLSGFSVNQTITTTPGASYTINFWLAGYYGNSFVVNWNGSTIFSLTNPGSFGYTEYTVNVTASTASTTLLFGVLKPQISSRSGFLLDDISVNRTGASVPDTGSTFSLLGLASLGLVALRRKLSC